LKDRALPPDLPLEYAQFFEAYLKQGVSAHVAQVDRDQAVLLAGLASSPESSARMGELYDSMASSEMMPVVVELSEKFDQIDPEASEAELEQIAGEFVAALGPFIAQLAAPAAAISLSGGADLLVQHANDVMNPAQARLAELIEAKVDAEQKASADEDGA
jgi:hypothetical protein